MKKLITLFSVLPVLLGLLLTGCTVEAPDSNTELVAPAGEELFGDYVAIGNSLTAGFMDGGLVINGQLNSFPKLIATQMGNSNFDQPYVSYPGVGSTKDPVNHPADVAGVLYWNGSSPSVVDWTPASTVMDPTSGYLMAIALPTPYHNLGVPGALLHDVMNAYDSSTSVSPGNSYFNFINRASFFGNVSVPATAQSPAYETASMFRQAVAKGPKLMTVWIGNNDILGSATNGTDALITDTTVFQAEFTALMQTLAGGLVQRNGFPSTIVVANIPSITSVPYFVPRTMLEAPTDMGGLGISWPWGYEETTAELLCFPGLAWLQDDDNQGSPVPASLTLSASEAGNIATAVATFNGIIAGVVDAVNASDYAVCGLMDANTLLAEQSVYARTHFMFLVGGGMSVEMAASTTMFSLDGIHPNNLGYGIVANEFINVINDLADTDVPLVDVSALEWDPTYGQAPLPELNAGSLDPEAAQAMGAIFR